MKQNKENPEETEEKTRELERKTEELEKSRKALMSLLEGAEESRKALMNILEDVRQREERPREREIKLWQLLLILPMGFWFLTKKISFL